jgi:hypothetical protein
MGLAQPLSEDQEISFKEDDFSRLVHLVVLPVACITRIDYTATSLLSEEPSRATADPQRFSDFFR